MIATIFMAGGLVAIFLAAFVIGRNSNTAKTSPRPQYVVSETTFAYKQGRLAGIREARELVHAYQLQLEPTERLEELERLALVAVNKSEQS